MLLIGWSFPSIFAARAVVRFQTVYYNAGVKHIVFLVLNAGLLLGLAFSRFIGSILRLLSGDCTVVVS